MNNLTLALCICIIVVFSSINPYIKKTVISSKNEVYIPFELFYIFVSFLACVIISFILFFYKKDWIYLLLGTASLIMTFILFMYKIQNDTYPNNMYIKMIISAILTVVPSFLFLFLIKKHDVSYLDPIIKPLILILIFILGITVFGENKQNTPKKWICIIGIVILIAVFTTNKSNLNEKSRK